MKKQVKKNPIKIIIFTISALLLVTTIFLYKTFILFDAKDIINENSKELQNLNFLVYVDDVLQKEIPNKESGYSLDTSRSHCENGTLVSWNESKWSVEIKEISTTKTKCYLYFENLYQEEELNKAIPNLGNELVPITFNETGKAIKADLTKEWYNYKEQRWANAVILKTPEEYQSGTEIPEENIESYFVWIPRYEYEIWNGETNTNDFTGLTNLNVTDTSVEKLNKQKAINIQFVTKNDEIKNGNATGTLLTHPAFTSFNVDGFWVGKFETGYDGAKSAGEAQKDEINSDKVIIKPNVYSWRGIQVANAFYTVYDYKRELDSHMMKNMEWGAVAYLANSEYGLCKGGTCTNIFPNNNSNFLTGYAAKDEALCGNIVTDSNCQKTEGTNPNTNGTYTYNYNDSKSQTASTTGNYYGVYDMSGGSHEYVMGVMLDSKNASPLSGRNETINSKFIGTYGAETQLIDGLPWPSNKYYDMYTYDISDQQFQRGKLGDATKEVGPFYSLKINETTSVPVSSYYSNQANFVNAYSPWFHRGGRFDSFKAGLMMFIMYGGGRTGDISFRIILSPF